MAIHVFKFLYNMINNMELLLLLMDIYLSNIYLLSIIIFCTKYYDRLTFYYLVSSMFYYYSTDMAWRNSIWTVYLMDHLPGHHILSFILIVYPFYIVFGNAGAILGEFLSVATLSPVVTRITMIFYTALYVVLIATTTLKLYEFLVGEPQTINKHATEDVASVSDDSAVAMAGHGQVVTKREIFLSRATTTNNFVGMAACATILSYTVDNGGDVGLLHDVSCEPPVCLAEFSVFPLFYVFCALFVCECGLGVLVAAFFFVLSLLLLLLVFFVLFLCCGISQQAPNFQFTRNAPCGNSYL